MAEQLNCDFCKNQAMYDFKTKMGPWANGCRDHYLQYRFYEELGIGKGQLLTEQTLLLTKEAWKDTFKKIESWRNHPTPQLYLTKEQAEELFQKTPPEKNKLSDEHREDLQKYVDYYKGKEEIYGDTGWPMSIAHAIEAALKELDELRMNLQKSPRKICTFCNGLGFKEYDGLAIPCDCETPISEDVKLGEPVPPGYKPAPEKIKTCPRGCLLPNRHCSISECAIDRWRKDVKN